MPGPEFDWRELLLAVDEPEGHRDRHEENNLLYDDEFALIHNVPPFAFSDVLFLG